MTDLQHKWNNIYQQQDVSNAQASIVLSRYSHLLPKQGKALDLACGLGGNAFLLAKHGLDVDAWDISSHVIEEINKHIPKGTSINAEAMDISQATLKKNHYDVITVSRFLDRQLIPQLISALKPKGLIFYQTFTLDKAFPSGPTNPKFLLEKGELLSLFSSLKPIAYHEESNLGDINKGVRNEALLVAQR